MFLIRGCKRPHYTGSSSNFRAQLRGMKLPKFVAHKIKEVLHADAKGLKFVVRTSHARSCFLHFGSEAGTGPFFNHVTGYPGHAFLSFSSRHIKRVT